MHAVTLCTLSKWDKVYCNLSVFSAKNLISHGCRHHYAPTAVYEVCCVCSSVASRFCQEGQSERTFPIFPLYPDFCSFSRFFQIFSLFFLIFGKFFAVKGVVATLLCVSWSCLKYSLPSISATSSLEISLSDSRYTMSADRYTKRWLTNLQWSWNLGKTQWQNIVTNVIVYVRGFELWS